MTNSLALLASRLLHESTTPPSCSSSSSSLPPSSLHHQLDSKSRRPRRTMPLLPALRCTAPAAPRPPVTPPSPRSRCPSHIHELGQRSEAHVFPPSRRNRALTRRATRVLPFHTVISAPLHVTSPRSAAGQSRSAHCIQSIASTRTLAPAVVSFHCPMTWPSNTRICPHSPCRSCCATSSDAAAPSLSSIFRSTCQFTLLIASTSRHTFRMYVKRRSVAAFRENMQYAHACLHHLVSNACCCSDAASACATPKKSHI
jgi:hypothetical protein